MLNPAEYPDVSVDDALRLATEPGYLLLDVREDDEWDAGHASAAVHAALSQFDPVAVPEAATVLCVCRSGGRSRRAADALLAAGRAAQNVAGGMTAWEAAGQPVVTSDGGPGAIG